MTELVYTESNDQYNAASVPIYQVRLYSTPVAGCFKTNMLSRRRSSKPRRRVALVNTTTRALAILHERTSSDTSQKS